MIPTPRDPLIPSAQSTTEGCRSPSGETGSDDDTRSHTIENEGGSLDGSVPSETTSVEDRNGTDSYSETTTEASEIEEASDGSDGDEDEDMSSASASIGHACLGNLCGSDRASTTDISTVFSDNESYNSSLADSLMAHQDEEHIRAFRVFTNEALSIHEDNRGGANNIMLRMKLPKAVDNANFRKSSAGNGDSQASQTAGALQPRQRMHMGVGSRPWMRTRSAPKSGILVAGVGIQTPKSNPSGSSRCSSHSATGNRDRPSGNSGGYGGLKTSTSRPGSAVFQRLGQARDGIAHDALQATVSRILLSQKGEGSGSARQQDAYPGEEMLVGKSSRAQESLNAKIGVEGGAHSHFQPRQPFARNDQDNKRSSSPATQEVPTKGEAPQSVLQDDLTDSTISSRKGEDQSGNPPSSEFPTDSKGRPFPYLIPSPIPGMPHTICFKGTPEENHAAGLTPFTKRKVFVRFNGTANTPVRRTFAKAGVRCGKSTSSCRWHVLWGCVPGNGTFGRLNRYQRVNHFPGTWEIGRKDRLCRNVARLQRTKGLQMDIIPRCFILPTDREALHADALRHPNRLYIRKPVASSRGRGVKMVKKPSKIPKKKICLVQRYIHNPLTINGYKVDIRLYVGVTSFDPLRVYIYEDGLVRFATEVYKRDKSSLGCRCMHLTNYSVNRHQENFVKNTNAEKDDVGSKWSLKALRRFLESTIGVDWSVIWNQFHDIVAKVMISVESKINTQIQMRVPQPQCCFEIFGCDILLDDTCKAWLLEVNAFPDLGASSPLDMKIKSALIEDMLHMVGIVPCDMKAIKRKNRAMRQRKLHLVRDSDAKGAKQRSKTIKDAHEMDFSGLRLEELPEFIRQTEAELHRAGGWEIVFPCRSDPNRYQHLFETERYRNVALRRYLGHKMGAKLQPADLLLPMGCSKLDIGCESSTCLGKH